MIGRCKWFDEKKGYGFIAVCDEKKPEPATEVFVHHKNIRTAHQGARKTLRSGEYVSMSVEDMEGGKTQAVDVTGVLGGPLMCESFQSKRKTRASKTLSDEISQEQ